MRQITKFSGSFWCTRRELADGRDRSTRCEGRHATVYYARPLHARAIRLHGHLGNHDAKAAIVLAFVATGRGRIESSITTQAFTTAEARDMLAAAGRIADQYKPMGASWREHGRRSPHSPSGRLNPTRLCSGSGCREEGSIRAGHPSCCNGSSVALRAAAVEIVAPALGGNGRFGPFKTSCTIRRTRRGTGSCRRHKGHDDQRRSCRVSERVAAAASPAATPPCGCGLSRNRQLLGTVTSNPPRPGLTCVGTVRQLPNLVLLWIQFRVPLVASGTCKTRWGHSQPRPTR